MTQLLVGLAGALFVAGIIGLVVGPPPKGEGAPHSGLTARLKGRFAGLSKPAKQRLVGGTLVGLVVAVVTGWVVAIVIIPAALVGLPFLLSPAKSGSSPERLQALEEWARGLSGVLTAGMGLDQALIRSLRTAPDEIRPEVTRLVQRLWANWPTDRALRAFADEIDDQVGDFIAGNLILAATSRGPGLAPALDGIAESVAAVVRARRQIAADQQKPRTTAVVVTLISIAVLGYLALSGSYIEPYSTPIGQVILVVLLAAYVGVLLWMRRMSKPPKAPRLLVAAEEGHR